MKYMFKINVVDTLELSAEGEKEQSLINMVFPDSGNYSVEKQGNKVLIFKLTDAEAEVTINPKESQRSYKH